MPRQFFITDLVCTIDPGGTRNCKPDVGTIRVNYTAVCQDWQVANPQCMVLVAGDTSNINGKNNVVSLVADNMDTTIASLSNAVRNRVNNGLTSKSIPLNVSNYTLVRDFLTALGQWFDPNYTNEAFWVSD